jgi:hypothetical protein
MRKVTKTIVDAFCNRRPRKCGNTHTDGTTFYLHGNAIAKWDEGKLFITLAGWDTVTTRERINGLGRTFGFSVHRDRGVTKLNVRHREYPTGETSWGNSIEIPHGEWIQPHEYAVKYGTDQ